ncbi:hypothetical protein FHS43_002365 [Streptosporangium becharense]|uniref:Phosphodiesterase n=1 Tax=Streptosporangium becharense TaxID=1816182 RepID=A0A7W9IJG1_9ACTN|nr:hypothetical protein [Streptosporangium becharense]MBB2911100.1 hypothetical protein [Streptosporangium becharense]MBB5821842.1 hypothetical protein [Streptosporangium becharense]
MGFRRPDLAEIARAVAYRTARARGGRALHKDGASFSATLRVVDHPRLGVPALDEPGEREALVRLSRATSLTKSLPDVLGLAVRLPGGGGAGGDLDILMSTSTWPRWMPFPSLGFSSSVYSTLISYDHPDGPLRLLAVPAERGRRISADLDSLVAAVADRPLEFALGVDHARRHPLGRLVVHTPLPCDAGEPRGYDPIFNGHPALRPYGWLRTARAGAYAGSRNARAAGDRPVPGGDRRPAQPVEAGARTP